MTETVRSAYQVRDLEVHRLAQLGTSAFDSASQNFAPMLGPVPGAQMRYACIALLRGLRFICTFVQHGCVDRLARAILRVPQ